MLGIIKIKNEYFLGLVSDVANIGEIYKENINDIFRIKKVKFISFKYGCDFRPFDIETKLIVNGIESILMEGFYFSYHSDLTNLLQRKCGTVNDPNTLFARSNKDYVWNYSMCRKFTTTQWLTPIIQGFVEIDEQDIIGKKCKLILISRRNHRRAGTRFNVRGIDRDGNVANMVETEQILTYKKCIYSYVQVRGSVPVFWNQSGVFSSINLTKTPEITYKAFTKHLNNLASSYKSILIFDLLSDKKPGEASLTKSFEENTCLYQKDTGAGVNFCHIDFHRERGNTVRYIYIRRET